MIFELRILSPVLVAALISPALAEDLTYKDYAKASEAWRRGFDKHLAAPKCREATKSYSARARCQGRASAHAGRGRATLISGRRDGRAAGARTQIPGLRQSATLSAVQRSHQYRRARRLA
jgi:hypothetical protein